MSFTSLKKEKERKHWVHPILRYREEGKFLKEQRDYQGRFKVYFRMSVAQFDALLAELEPRIKKTTDFSELCVQGSIYSALFCKMKWVNLTIAILDFGACLYGGSETPLKMLATDAKKWNAIQFFFMTYKYFGGSV